MKAILTILWAIDELLSLDGLENWLARQKKREARQAKLSQRLKSIFAMDAIAGQADCLVRSGLRCAMKQSSI